MEFLKEKGTILSLPMHSDFCEGANVVSSDFFYFIHLNGTNFIRHQRKFWLDLREFCREFQKCWDEREMFKYYSKRELFECQSETMMKYIGFSDEKECGKLRLSLDGVRLFKQGDGWNLLVGLNLRDIEVYKVYASIGEAIRYMEEHNYEFKPSISDEAKYLLGDEVEDYVPNIGAKEVDPQFEQDDKDLTEMANNETWRHQLEVEWECDFEIQAKKIHDEWIEKIASEKKKEEEFNNDRDNLPF